MIPDFTSLNYFNLSPQGGKKLRIKNGAEFFFCVPFLYEQSCCSIFSAMAFVLRQNVL